MGTVYLAEAIAAGDGEGGSGKKVAHQGHPPAPREHAARAGSGSGARGRSAGGSGTATSSPPMASTSWTSTGSPTLYLTMEYVEGQTLRSLLAELGRVPEELCRHIGTEVAKALLGGPRRRCRAPRPQAGERAHHARPGREGDGSRHRAFARTRPSASRRPASSWVRSATPRPSSSGPRRWTGAPTSTRSASCSTSWRRASTPSPARTWPRSCSATCTRRRGRPRSSTPSSRPSSRRSSRRCSRSRRDERFASAGELQEVLQEGEQSDWWKERAQSIRDATQRPLRRIRIPRTTALYGRAGDDRPARVALRAARRRGDGQVVHRRRARRASARPAWSTSSSHATARGRRGAQLPVRQLSAGRRGDGRGRVLGRLSRAHRRGGRRKRARRTSP